MLAAQRPEKARRPSTFLALESRRRTLDALAADAAHGRSSDESEKNSMDNLTCNSVLNNASDHCNQVLPPDQTASGPKPSICQRRQLPPKGPQSGFWPHGFLEARTIRFLKMCGFLALIPQASQRPLGQKTLRDPFDIRSFPFWPPGWGGGVPGLQNWFTALLSTRAYTMLGH